MDDNAIFGEKDEQGAVIRDVEFCALTGRRITNRPHVTVAVPHTHLFYKLSALAEPTDADLEALSKKAVALWKGRTKKES